MCGCRNGTVTSVKIAIVKDSSESYPDIRDHMGRPYTNIGFSGSTLKLKAMLEGTGRFDSAVVWSLKDGSGGSKISADGLLSISPELSELKENLTVTATSKQTPGVSGNLIMTIVHDANAYKGKWVREWKSFKDTIIIRDESYTVKMGNGDSYTINQTKWLLFNNGNSLMRADYPDAYWMNGIIERVNGKKIQNNHLGGLKPGDNVIGLIFSINKNKNLGKVGMQHSGQFHVYDKVQ